MQKPVSAKESVIVNLDSYDGGVHYNKAVYEMFLRKLANDHIWFKIGLPAIAAGYEAEINRYLKSLGCLTIFDARLGDGQHCVLPHIEKRKYDAFVVNINCSEAAMQDYIAFKGKMSLIANIGAGFALSSLVKGIDCVIDDRGIMLADDPASDWHFTFLSPQ